MYRSLRRHNSIVPRLGSKAFQARLDQAKVRLFDRKPSSLLTLTPVGSVSLEPRPIRCCAMRLHSLRIQRQRADYDHTGSRVLCRSVDEFERLRGTNLAWFALDELTYTPEAAWLVLEGRLRDLRAARLCGFAVWTPKGFDWVYRKFISEPRRG
jgi:hypothetical protein